jgi:sugar phosphate isomerase/epimerase
MDYSIASYSFHGLLESGQQDMFKYITDCKEIGCALLDPWNGHLAPLIEEDKAIKASSNPTQAQFSAAGLDYARKVKAAADDAGLPVGCLAIDGAHMYEPTPEARAITRACGYRWLEVADILRSQQVRMDTGGTVDLPDEQFTIIIDGFKDVVKRAGDKGIEVVLENHWGASHVPENVLRVIEAVPGLALLFDSGNWAPGRRDDGWKMTAHLAKSVHIKAREFDADGNEPTMNVPGVVKLLVETGYKGCWGVESVPREGDEYEAARKTIDLIRKTLVELGVQN